MIVIDDYLSSDAFVHTPESDRLAKASSIHSLIAAPIVGEDGPLGTIEVFRTKPDQFDEIDAAVLGGLADQAAVAMTNARLIAELARSRAEIELRAERERSLRDIAARITSLRDPGEVLEQVVEETKRLLASDGAHLTRLDEEASRVDPGRGRRRRPAHGELDQDPALSGGRGDQRPRRPRRHAGLDVRLPDRPAHPAREGRHHHGQPARVARYGCGSAPLARGGRDRDVGDLVPQATVLRARGPRRAPGAGRSGGDRDRQLEPGRAPDRFRAALPPPRPELAGPGLVDWAGCHVLLPVGHVRAAHRLAARGAPRAALRGPRPPLVP